MNGVDSLQNTHLTNYAALRNIALWPFSSNASSALQGQINHTHNWTFVKGGKADYPDFQRRGKGLQYTLVSNLLTQEVGDFWNTGAC